MKNSNDNSKKKSFISSIFGNLFGGKEEMSIFEEADVQSPWKTIINTFRSNKVAMTALIIFVFILLVVLIGPIFKPIELSFNETTQINVAPGFDIMDMPDSLKGNIKDLSVGPTFSVAISEDGELHIWGKTKISRVLDIRKGIPENMGKLAKVSAGQDHVVVLNEEGKVFSWGSDRQQQGTVPPHIANLNNIVDIVAGYQVSGILTEGGETHFFGNTRSNDINQFHGYQGQIAKFVLTADTILGLTFDGEAVFLGTQQTGYRNIPEDIGKVVDIANTSFTMAAVNEDGQVFVWGNLSEKGEGNIPETDEKIVKISGGRYHYTALTESGNVISWGSNKYKESQVPASVNKNIKDIYVDSYQNYAITNDDEVITWGLKGYLLGSDDFGRDIFARLLNGGRMSMTIGAVAVIISTIMGVTVGGISGYFGGRIDLILQRISEMVASLPFLPFAMILSALIGNKLDPNQRIFLIMVILGLLSWTGLQRIVRAQVLSVREQEYVIAAKAVGIKEVNIVFRHILPNVISVIIVNATLNFATSMLTEATLSYLGFGVPPPRPTWGNMLYGSNNSIVIQNYWWRWVFASIILGICVICINLIGDGLNDAIDPKSQER